MFTFLLNAVMAVYDSLMTVKDSWSDLIFKNSTCCFLRSMKEHHQISLIPKQGCNFVTVWEKQISFKFYNLIHDSIRETDSHLWSFQESLGELIR